MCLIFMSFKTHPDYKLIVAANRDEFYNRKTAPAHFWTDYPHVLGGRDMEASGTWLGVNRQGKVSMITNYRDFKNIRHDAPSRGHLVSGYLTGNTEPEMYMRAVEMRGAMYNGFKLIAGTPDKLYYYSNYKHGVELIAPGLHGLSNHLLNTQWPKVRKGLDKMRPLMNTKIIDADMLLDALYDAEIAGDDELPDTGLGIEQERMLSSMFIKGSEYGSRSSAVLFIDRAETVFLKERVYDPASLKYTDNSFTFTIEKQ